MNNEERAQRESGSPRKPPTPPLAPQRRPAQPTLRASAAKSSSSQRSTPRPAPVPAAPEPVAIDYTPKPPAPGLTYASLKLRQTLIPPCLVIGVGFIGFGVAYFVQPPASALRHVNGMYAIAVTGVGATSLAMAIVLMLFVRSEQRLPTA